MVDLKSQQIGNRREEAEGEEAERKTKIGLVGEVFVMLLALLNCLLGVVFGLRYRVMILAPLIAITVLEAFFLALPAGTWISVLWL
jgi:hypothetical protein